MEWNIRTTQYDQHRVLVCEIGRLKWPLNLLKLLLKFLAKQIGFNWEQIAMDHLYKIK